MRTVLSALTALFFLSGTPPAQGEEGKGAQDVRGLIHEVHRAHPEHFQWKQKKAAPLHLEGFRVVLISEGRRYTVDYRWWVGGLEVYERPDGTGGDRSLMCYRDVNLDGIVDYGIRGGECVRRPITPYVPNVTTPFEEYEAYQARYERVLVALRAAITNEQLVVSQVEGLPLQP